jgi:hypothetical protein
MCAIHAQRGIDMSVGLKAVAYGGVVTAGLYGYYAALGRWPRTVTFLTVLGGSSASIYVELKRDELEALATARAWSQAMDEYKQSHGG